MSSCIVLHRYTDTLLHHSRAFSRKRMWMRCCGCLDVKHTRGGWLFICKQLTPNTLQLKVQHQTFLNFTARFWPETTGYVCFKTSVVGGLHGEARNVLSKNMVEATPALESTVPYFQLNLFHIYPVHVLAHFFIFPPTHTHICQPTNLTISPPTWPVYCNLLSHVHLGINNTHAWSERLWHVRRTEIPAHVYFTNTEI